MYEITGKIKSISKEQIVSDKFKKREFVIEEADAKFPNTVMFELVQDKCSLIDDSKVGDNVKVSFNVRGREWTSPKGEVKHFTSLNAWKIGNAEATAEVITSDGDGSDLPF